MWCSVSHSAVPDTSRPPRTRDHQAPLSMEFSRPAYWSEFPFPSPGDLPDPGIKSGSLLHCRWTLYCLSHNSKALSMYEKMKTCGLIEIIPLICNISWLLWMKHVTCRIGKQRICSHQTIRAALSSTPQWTPKGTQGGNRWAAPPSPQPLQPPPKVHPVSPVGTWDEKRACWPQIAKEGRMNSHDPLCLADTGWNLLQNFSAPLT